MRKLVVLMFGLIGLVSSVFAQSEIDALRFSRLYYGGTARFEALSGAFGALGGDMSSFVTNPAGLAVYRSSEVTITPVANFTSSEARYLSSTTVDNDFKLGLGNLGLVVSFELADDESAWSRVNFGVSYNRTNDFNLNTLAQGINRNSSFVDNIALDYGEYADMDLIGQLAESTDLIFLDADSSGYLSDFSDGELLFDVPKRQKMLLEREGHGGEYSFAIGANYAHTLYLGGSINIQSFRYYEKSAIQEIDDQNNVPLFNKASYGEGLDIEATGTNLKLGCIYRPIDALRIGLALHTPTYLSISEEYEFSMTSSFDNGDGWVEKKNGTYDYSLITPGKYLISAAYILGKQALVSLEYEGVNYKQMRFEGEDIDEFAEVNQSINELMRRTHNFRAGLEYTTGPLSARLGYAMYQSPFSDNVIDYGRSQVSAGFGVRGDGFFVDFAYVLAFAKEDFALYPVHVDYPAEIAPYEGYVQQETKVNVTNTFNKFVLTIGFKF